MRTQLLCTFAFGKELRNVIDDVVDHHNILYNKIFILKNADNPKEYMCTYNVEPSADFNILASTISLHRKKQTNTLYTINGLNALIRTVNNNVLDMSYQVDWENYRNSMLTTNEDALKRVNTEVYDIVYIKVK